MTQENISYWRQTVSLPDAPPLQKSARTDVLIVGGGITGITCAYCLALEGAKPLLLEAGEPGGGTTGGTTGKVTVQHGLIYDHLLRAYGPRTARAYFRSQTEGLELIRRWTGELGIDCRLTARTSWVYAASPEEREAVEREYEALQRLGLPVLLDQTPAFPTPNYGMVGVPEQAVFHPLRYLRALAQAAVARGARICGGTRALDLEKGPPLRVHCGGGLTVDANHVVMATQYPFHDGLNLFFTRLYPKRSYAVALRPEHPWPGDSYISVGSPTRSVRTHLEGNEPILIVGGEGHPPGRDGGGDEGRYDALVSFARELAGPGEVLAKWSAQDYETPDRLPYIGKAAGGRNLYAAAGFGKWGMTSGTLAGKLLAQLVLHGKCDYEGLYSKGRPDFSRQPARTAREALTPVGELVKSKFKGTEPFAGLLPGQGRAVSFRGRRAGLYRGEDGLAFAVDVTCPHMGTELTFNAAEKTWDCPAHGGRFDVRGRRLEGPPHADLPLLFQGDFSLLEED